jgi:hypothetical protein
MIHNREITERPSLDHNQDKKLLEPTVESRPIPTKAWFVLVLSTLATFLSFMVLDPDPSLLLSICVAVNVAILGWAMHRSFQLDLLLSPMMLLYVGPATVMYYSWGNLGARIAGEARYAANMLTLEYYPLVALLSTIGLILYCWVVFGVFHKSFQRVAIRYQDLCWQPRQLLGAILLVAAILTYLSVKYSFTGGYFRGAEGNFDRWLMASMNAFVFLIVIISLSLLARDPNKRSRTIASLGIILSLLLALGLRSRTFMLMILVLIVLCWLTLKPRQVRLSFFLVIGLTGIIMFGLGTVIKSLQGETKSILENLSAISSVGASEMISRTNRGIELDRQYRASGFEYPAAVLRCLDYGAEPAYGQALVGAFFQGLPGFLRPAGLYSERGSIAIHFWKYCPFYDDSIAIPLLSGLGDWGMPGVFIYAVFGLFSLVLWRLAQSTPRLFIAYLLVPFFPDYLFWEGIFTYAKTMAFLWLILWITGSILMPRWLPSTNSLDASNSNVQ